MKILLSNDDGYDAPGLEALYETLKDSADLFVVAPETNHSGAGCSITVNQPMKAKFHNNGFVSVTGKPADCVYLGIHELAPWTPDLVISGINLGANMGEDLLYSGTVGAALEGRWLTYPSIAVSAAAFHQPGSESFMDPNYDTAAKVILDLIENYDLSIIDSSIVLNVNTPNKVFSADLDYKITSIGKWGKRNPPHVEKEKDDQITYWTSHRENCPPNESNSDISALKNNTISISPIYPKFSYGTEPNINFNLQKK